MGGWLVHCRVTPALCFSAGTHLYTWLEKDTMRIKCLTQEHNTMSLACGIELGLLDLEFSTLKHEATVCQQQWNVKTLVRIILILTFLP